MKHVLHLSTWHPCIDGVSGSFVVEQCEALHDAGVTVGLVFSRIEGLRAFSVSRAVRGLPATIASTEPIPTIGFKSWNVPFGQKYVRSFNTLMLERLFLSYIARHGKPELLHAHVALETGPAVRRLARREKLDYILTEHSSQVLRGAMTASENEIVGSVYSDARSVLAVSQPLAQQIKAIAPRANVNVVGNVVRDAVFKLRESGCRARSTIDIVSISSLVTAKRIHLVIDALSLLPAAVRERVTYHIIGDGPEMGNLRARAARCEVNAVFLGNMPHEAAMAKLAVSDFLVHPSSFETFGLVLAEAMAIGRPVIATRCGGPEDFVDTRCGILVPVDDVQALADAILQMSSELALWHARTAEISAYCRTRFHENVILERIMREYQ